MSDFDFVQLRRLDPTLLLVLDQALVHRRLTVVAERLGLTPSAISHALGRLRTIYGDPLFLRRAGGIEPTPVALALAAPVRHALAAMAGTIDVARGFDPASARRVFRVSALDYAMVMLGPALLGAIATDAPGMTLALRSIGRAQSLKALDTGEIDLMLGVVPPDPARLSRRVLIHEHFVLAARNGHPAFTDGPPDAAGFAGLSHILVSAGGDLAGAVDAALAAVGLHRRVVAAVPQFLGALAAIAESDLVAAIPAGIATRHAARFGVSLHPMPVDAGSFELASIRALKPAADLGLDWLEARIVAAVPAET